MTSHGLRRRLRLTDGRGSARRALRRLCWLGLCVVATAHAEPATSDHAQPGPQEDQEATRAFLSGKDDFESGRFAEAKEQFQRAYLLTKDPALLYNLGQSYRKMGRCAEAQQAYQQFLQAAPSSPLAQRAQKHLVALQSSCVPTAGSAPTADSGASTTGTFGDVEPTVSAGRTAPSAPRVSRAPTAPAPVSPRQAGNPVHGRTAETEADGTWRWLPWATMISGLVAAGTAIGLEIHYLQRESQWTAEDRNLEKGPAPGETDEDWLARQEANDRLGHSIRAVRTGAIATGIAGVVLVAASGVMFQLTPAHSSAADGAAGLPPALHVGITRCDVTATGVTLSGTF
ncbi:MAG: hypothetical protein JW940_34770 [Polyangiaceae bacterium]|nr:hypothetical protein [Polyangiaceae bacterium]